MVLKIMSLLTSKKTLDAYSSDYCKLNKRLSNFKVQNALLCLFKNPDQYLHKGIVWKFISYTSEKIINLFSFLSLGFIFIVKNNYCHN